MPGSIPQRERSTQNSTHADTKNSRFWMSTTSRTVIVRSVPNGGDVRAFAFLG
jgi:hypothetical protein